MSLSFINPWFLFGLLGIAVPIYLHLYFRKQPLKRDFPSLRLIKISVEFVARKQKIRNIILLLLRILVILFLVLALAQPFSGIGASAGAGVPNAFVVLLDNSMSMGCTNQGVSLFNSAKARALELLDQMKANGKATVGFINNPGGLVFSQLTWDKSALKDTIANASLSAADTNLYSSMLPALKLLTPLKSYRRTIYIVTDMTEVSWKPFLEKYDISKIDPGIDLVLIPVGNAEPENLSISSLEATSAIIMRGKPVDFKIKVSNHSLRERKTRVSFIVKDVKKLEKQITIPPNSVKEIKFTYKFVGTGITEVKAELPADSLSLDNSRYLSLKILNQQKILIIKSDDIASNKKKHEDLFLKFALNPLNRRKNTDFVVESRTVSEVSLDEIGKYTVVCFVNLRRIPENMIKAVSEYLISGGNLMTFMGDSVEPQWYNENLIDKLGSAYILPARIYKRVGNSVSKSVAYQMTDIDFGYLALKLFSNPENGDLSKARVFEFFQIKPNPAAMVLCRMSHGLPGITAEKCGSGRSVLVNFSSDTSWTDWPLKPTFLPFMHQMVISMLTGNDLHIGKLSPGTPISMTIKQNDVQKISMTLPDKEKVSIPIQKQGKGIAHFSTNKTDQAGFYKLYIKGKNRIDVGFAVNSPSAESNLKRIDLRQIPRFIVLTHKAGSRRTIGKNAKILQTGFDLGRPFLWLLLILTLVEAFFANIPIRKGT